jgi:hypothetical protein
MHDMSPAFFAVLPATSKSLGRPTLRSTAARNFLPAASSQQQQPHSGPKGRRMTGCPPEASTSASTALITRRAGALIAGNPENGYFTSRRRFIAQP